jgi:nucleoid-associated protein YgaU
MARPEDRYVNLEVKTLENGRRVYKSARPKSVYVNTDIDVTLIGNERDRMDVIAKNVYGSPMDWWRIAAANRRVNGSLHVLPNTPIIIPRK